jgi:hypothetical protein
MSCARCVKYVALPEKRNACGKVYHIECFLCGGDNSDGCGKKLTLDGYSDRQGQPYCKTCYGRLFAPKGFINGTANFNSYDEANRSTISSPRPKHPDQPPPPARPSQSLVSERLVNDRNVRAIETEVLPSGGIVSGTKGAFDIGYPISRSSSLT